MLVFDQLWKNHPTISGEDDPCSTNGKSNFSNQCAIRLGVCLQRSGADTSKIPGVTRCWYHAKEQGHIIRAQELANGLNKYRIAGLDKVRKVAPRTFGSDLSGKKGIIFFRDYWPRRGESGDDRSGDHIDLWNGSRLTDWTSWLRIQLGLSIDGVWSDFSDSKTIWFWQIR